MTYSNLNMECTFNDFTLFALADENFILLLGKFLMTMISFLLPVDASIWLYSLLRQSPLILCSVLRQYECPIDLLFL